MNHLCVCIALVGASVVSQGVSAKVFRAMPATELNITLTKLESDLHKITAASVPALYPITTQLDSKVEEFMTESVSNWFSIMMYWGLKLNIDLTRIVLTSNKIMKKLKVGFDKFRTMSASNLNTTIVYLESELNILTTKSVSTLNKTMSEANITMTELTSRVNETTTKLISEMNSIWSESVSKLRSNVTRLELGLSRNVKRTVSNLNRTLTKWGTESNQTTTKATSELYEITKLMLEYRLKKIAADSALELIKTLRKLPYEWRKIMIKSASDLTTNSHSKPCETQTYCLNGGTCMILTQLSVQYCQCVGKFAGDRCEEPTGH